MRKFEASGVRKTERERSPGTLLGNRMTPCFRCGREVPEADLSPVPPDAGPGDPRVLVCSNCK